MVKKPPGGADHPGKGRNTNTPPGTALTNYWSISAVLLRRENMRQQIDKKYDYVRIYIPESHKWLKELKVKTRSKIVTTILSKYSKEELIKMIEEK